MRAMRLSEGQEFAGYTIVRPLGSGGMGEVYLAQHPRLPRQDALKVLPAEVSSDVDYRARFEREADFASKLWHPHIVSVHDRGDHDHQLWIAMDFVDGDDAARLLANRNPDGMPAARVVDIITAVAGALDYAHKRGLLHRDVKPANIMLTHDEDEQRILLADFGIARTVEDIGGLTATNMTIGTVAYAAPEQLMGEHIDGRADQYALAATAYHLLTGSQMFPNSNPAVVISRHLNAAPPKLSDTHPELAPLDRVLTLALAKSPEQRFRLCMDFARALNDELRQPSAHGPATATQQAPAPAKMVDVADPAAVVRSDAATQQAPTPHASKSADARADDPPQRLGTRRTWLIAAAIGAVILTAVIVAVMHHQSGTSTQARTVSRDVVAQQISAKMTDTAGNKPDSVSCPEDLKAQIGAQLNCTMKVKGQDYNVNVTATSINGDKVDFDTAETVDKDVVARQVSDRLANKVGHKPDSVTCPDNLKGTPGATLRCALTDGGQTYGVTVTVAAVDAGEVGYGIQVDDQATTAPAGANGYSSLLITAQDIDITGDTFTMSPPVDNPNGKTGVAAVFSNQSDTRELGDTIMILPDPTAAATAVQRAKAAIGGNVIGQLQPITVGDGGTIAQGPSPDGSKAVTVMIFAQGRAFVTLEFDSKPGDPVPPNVTTNIAMKQAAAIAARLAK